MFFFKKKINMKSPTNITRIVFIKFHELFCRGAMWKFSGLN